MIFKSKVLPRYAETDQMGIIHHSVYAIWYEEARTEFLNAIGLPYNTIEEMGVMTPLVELNCKYHKPAYYNEEVTIETKFIAFTPIKFIVQYDVFNAQNEKLNTGTTTLTWVDKETFKIVNMQKKFPEMFHKIASYVEKP